jgi:xanthine dehydrogenase accessory factor
MTSLRFAVQSSAKYIGMLGSRRKTKVLFDTLENEGIDRANLERVVAPIGFYSGSEMPEEIAISIAAGMIAVRKNLDIRPMKKAWQNLKKSAEASGKQEETIRSS